jgi:hypothetical protein
MAERPPKKRCLQHFEFSRCLQAAHSERAVLMNKLLTGGAKPLNTW